MSSEIVVALISALVVVLSVVLPAWAVRGTARLQDQLEERRRQVTKEELVEQVMSRYREPLYTRRSTCSAASTTSSGRTFLESI